MVAATGWKSYDPEKLNHLGYGLSQGVKTLEEFEHFVAEGTVPDRVTFILCAGSRDEDHLPYCSAYCCTAALKQALYHLLKNACQAMEKSTEKALILRIRDEDGSARLDVEDTGHGISAEAAPHIYNPFFTTRDPGEGMGMGLAIVHRIIDSHSGRIRHEPGPGGGTRFIITLPSRASGDNVPQAGSAS